MACGLGLPVAVATRSSNPATGEARSPAVAPPGQLDHWVLRKHDPRAHGQQDESGQRKFGPPRAAGQAVTGQAVTGQAVTGLAAKSGRA